MHRSIGELLPLKPHVMELLDWLDSQQIVYGVATATYGELAEAALKRLHVWERLAFLLTEQEAGAPKTQPRIFQLAAQKLHLGRRQIAVAEDSLHALQCARAAGFFTVGCMMQPIRRHGSRSVRRQRCMCTIFWK